MCSTTLKKKGTIDHTQKFKAVVIYVFKALPIRPGEPSPYVVVVLSILILSFFSFFFYFLLFFTDKASLCTHLVVDGWKWVDHLNVALKA
jgi:hypothetical protein